MMSATLKTIEVQGTEDRLLFELKDMDFDVVVETINLVAWNQAIGCEIDMHTLFVLREWVKRVKAHIENGGEIG
jgi:hypothetical protein